MPQSEAQDTSTRPAAGDTLAARLLAPDEFEPLVADCAALAEAEIKQKGMTLRTALKMVRKLKPDIVERSVRELMPDFVHALEPCYAEYRAQPTRDFRAYLMAHPDAVADAAVSAADKRAGTIHNRTIASAYQRVRDRARREVFDAMPEIADTLARHA